MGISSTKSKDKIPEDVALSIAHVLKNEGYFVKRGIQYPKRFSSFNSMNHKDYVLDIFAYKKADDMVFVKYENCADALSHKNENILKSISTKPGVKFHILVPSCCKERAISKSRIMNLPVKIDCLNNWKNLFQLKGEAAK